MAQSTGTGIISNQPSVYCKIECYNLLKISKSLNILMPIMIQSLWFFYHNISVHLNSFDWHVVVSLHATHSDLTKFSV